MKAIILSAGVSKRLQPIRDKNFINFLGKPLLLWQIEQLLKVGLTEIIIVAAKQNLEEIRALVQNVPAKIEVVEQVQAIGQAGAVLAAEEFIKNDSVLIVSNNDLVDNKAYSDILRAAENGDSFAYICGKKVSKYFPGGYLKVEQDGKISGIVEKPGAGNEPSDMINLVLHLFKDANALLEAIKSAKTEKDDCYEVAMDNLIKAGKKFSVVPYDGFWQAAKYPWHVLNMMNHFLENLPEGRTGSEQVDIAPTAIVRGKVYLEEGVRLMDHAIVAGPAYLGKNTIVAMNALVRGSHLGDNCIVGFGTEIARSYLGNGVWTHTNYVGDSIIGNNNSFGSGTVTGNLRLDEANIPVNVQDKKTDSETNKLGLITGDDVRCGINVSFMPGVKIGNNCFIGGGITVGQDIADNKFVYGKTELVIKDNTAKLDATKREEMKKVFKK